MAETTRTGKQWRAHKLLQRQRRKADLCVDCGGPKLSQRHKRCNPCFAKLDWVKAKRLDASLTSTAEVARARSQLDRSNRKMV